MSEEKRIGIMGGTFDPIHNGHLRMGEAAWREFALDEVWFMPTGTPAYKNGQHRVTQKEHRAAMTELAVREFGWARCSRIEVERSGNTYTADTLTELTEEYPDTSFYYIVGADSLNYMDRWYHPERIFQKACVAVAMRSTQSQNAVAGKIRALTAQFGARIILMHQEEYDISSTELRTMIAGGKDISSYVPKQVQDYIREHSLYREH